MAAQDRAAAVFKVAKAGDAAEVARLLDAEPELLEVRGQGPPRAEERPTLLQLAAEYGRLEVVTLLIGRGAKLDRADLYHSTALWWAAYRGRVQVTRALLLAGADHTIRGGTASDRHPGYTPRRVALENGRWKAAKLIKLWKGELQRAYVLHKARALHDDAATRQQSPAAPVPAYLRPRTLPDSVIPCVQVGATQEEAEEEGEERAAMVGYVVKGLPVQLYHELLAGFPFTAAYFNRAHAEDQDSDGDSEAGLEELDHLYEHEHGHPPERKVDSFYTYGIPGSTS